MVATSATPIGGTDMDNALIEYGAGEFPQGKRDRTSWATSSR